MMLSCVIEIYAVDEVCDRYATGFVVGELIMDRGLTSGGVCPLWVVIPLSCSFLKPGDHLVIRYRKQIKCNFELIFGILTSFVSFVGRRFLFFLG